MSLEQSFPIAEIKNPESPETIIESPHKAATLQFLGESQRYVSNETLATILADVEDFQKKSAHESGDQKTIVSYNKYKKTFFVGESPVTAGQVVASRHLRQKISLPETLDQSLEGKKLRSVYSKKQSEDHLQTKLNKALAESLEKEIASKDMLKAKAYRAIAERSHDEEKNEQLGVLAEKIMHGVVEMIAIDRPDLGVSVHAANAYQDVEEKIDFIIATKQKRRGAGIESKDFPPEEKHVGIQFTINTSKESFKKEQIAKAKERGVDMDDIVYCSNR